MVVDALRCREFAPVFAAAHRHGISWNELDEATGLKADRISDYVKRGTYPNPRIETVERIADGLQIPGWMVGLTERPWELTPPADSGREMSAVNRRDLLTAGLVLPLAGISAARDETEAALAYAGVEDVTDVEAAAERYSAGYRGRAPEEMLGLLAGRLKEVAPLMKLKHTTAVGKDLARAVAQLGGMAAIVLHDMGRHELAEQWFVTAVKVARRSTDRQTVAWVQARRAMVPLNYGAPRVAAKLAAEARREAGSGETAAAALAASVAARAYALTGQHEEADQALRAADRIAGLLSHGESADTWLGYCEQKHHVHRSQALTSMTNTAAAREAQLAGIALSTRMSMTRTLLLLDGAVCVRRDGDPFGACEAAVEAFDQAPDRFRAGLVRRRAVELFNSVPDNVRQSTAGRSLGAALISA
ncbi:helix-turn-helix domain-containing protein [Actinoplanes subglobosus]|uniref:Helix-turn-helix domain-containing protein n=1 Tax=Actinoplanes subglobosus TaxID=1547892 RepID=A0ABV8J602_9ACTN